LADYIFQVIEISLDHGSRNTAGFHKLSIACVFQLCTCFAPVPPLAQWLIIAELSSPRH
jgi:hypothetical protein